MMASDRLPEDESGRGWRGSVDRGAATKVRLRPKTFPQPSASALASELAAFPDLLLCVVVLPVGNFSVFRS